MDVCERAALRAANDARGLAGAPALTALRPGRPGDSERCSVSATVLAGTRGMSCATTGAGVELWVCSFPFEMPDHTVHLDEDAEHFVRAYDEGKYPALVADRPVAA